MGVGGEKEEEEMVKTLDHQVRRREYQISPDSIQHEIKFL